MEFKQVAEYSEHMAELSIVKNLSLIQVAGKYGGFRYRPGEWDKPIQSPYAAEEKYFTSRGNITYLYEDKGIQKVSAHDQLSFMHPDATDALDVQVSPNGQYLAVDWHIGWTEVNVTIHNADTLEIIKSFPIWTNREFKWNPHNHKLTCCQWDYGLDSSGLFWQQVSDECKGELREYDIINEEDTLIHQWSFSSNDDDKRPDITDFVWNPLQEQLIVIMDYKTLHVSI